jgi:hypothetical protein
VTTVQALGTGAAWNVSYNVSGAFTISVVSTESSLAPGNTLSYVATADPSGASQVVIASEEDFADIRAADDATMEARSRGVKPWEVVRKDLGL